MKRETHKQLTVSYFLSLEWENMLLLAACNRKTIMMTTNEKTYKLRRKYEYINDYYYIDRG